MAIKKQKHIIVIGASAGGLAPMLDVLSVLPPTLDAPVVVAIHGAADSRLTEVLHNRTQLPVIKVVDGQRLVSGTIAVCPGGEHTRIEHETLRLGRAPNAPRFQPSVDLLFETAAAQYGAGTVAVVLSGNLNDGTAGARAVHTHGGITLVQAPGEASFSSMPASVVLHDHPDQTLQAKHIPLRLLEIVGERGLSRAS